MEMIKEKVEMILGSVKDQGARQHYYGWIGWYICEIFKDITFGLAPLTAYDAQKMINKLKSKKY